MARQSVLSAEETRQWVVMVGPVRHALPHRHRHRHRRHNRLRQWYVRVFLEEVGVEWSGGRRIGRERDEKIWSLVLERIRYGAQRDGQSLIARDQSEPSRRYGADHRHRDRDHDQGHGQGGRGGWSRHGMWEQLKHLAAAAQD